MKYALLDSGEGEKLEQFGEVLLIRPAAQALWRPRLPKLEWEKAHARFSREPKNQWQLFKALPERWEILLEGIRLSLKRTDFGHVGVFPEHTQLWPWMFSHPLQGARILNLFAYSGATSLAVAKQGATVTHLDAAIGMIEWAKENAVLNRFAGNIRWIVDDVRKYLARAIRRKERYDAILLDPPSFGRGKSGEIFKIEKDLPLILRQCCQLLSEQPLFLLFTCHTPGYTPLAVKQLLQEVFPKSKIESGEMYIEQTISRNLGSLGPSEAIHANNFQNPYLTKNPDALQGRVLQGNFSLPSGTFGRCTP